MDVKCSWDVVVVSDTDVLTFQVPGLKQGPDIPHIGDAVMMCGQSSVVATSLARTVVITNTETRISVLLGEEPMVIAINWIILGINANRGKYTQWKWISARSVTMRPIFLGQLTGQTIPGHGILHYLYVGRPVKLKIDSGANTSPISPHTYRKLPNVPPLKP